MKPIEKLTRQIADINGEAFAKLQTAMHTEIPQGVTLLQAHDVCKAVLSTLNSLDRLGRALAQVSTQERD